MLTQTFCHISGVGHITERSLWSEGCSDWDTYLADPTRYHVGVADVEAVIKAVKISRDKLAQGEYQYFRKALGMNDAWRAWQAFRESCVYLDIETNGGSSGESITMVGLYDGKEFRCLVKGQDLDSFRDIISQYSMIVTFFGASFDVPMLQKRFPDVKFDQIHLDLCPTLRKLGLRGGLKKIEKLLGIARGEDTDGLDGLSAIRLWHAYNRHGDEKSLETLIAYNREDVVNLEKLSEYAYENLRSLTLASSQRSETPL